MKNVKGFLLFGLAAAIFLGACRKEQMDQYAGNGTQNQANSLTVKMTDNPGDYLGLDMEIVQVDAYLEGSGWVTLNNEIQYVDVVRLTNGNSAEIAFKTDLQAGNYSKVKVIFGDMHKLTLMVDASDNSGNRIAHQTDIQIGGNKEIIVEVDANVNASAGATVLIDFDVAKSVIADVNKYVVSPVLTWIRDEKTAVTGDVNGAISAAVVLTNGKDSVSAYTDIEGKFYLRGMKPGVYTLVVYPARKFILDALNEAKRIEGVVVVEGEVKYMGEIAVK